MATRIVLQVLINCFIIVLFDKTTNAQSFESPCPRLFVYEAPGKENDRWYGIITLLSESDLNGVWLRLMFDEPSQQLGNWFGEVVRRGAKEYLVKNRNFVLKAGTPYALRFFVKYNPDQSIPRFVGARLNARQVCPEVPVTTTPSAITGELNTSPPDEGSFDAQAQPAEKPPQSNPRPSNSGSSGPDFGSDDNQCGIVNSRYKRQTYYYYYDGDQYHNNQGPRNPYYSYYRYINSIRNVITTTPPTTTTIAQVQPVPLIYFGQKTARGEYPWHAAIYQSRGVSLSYSCGGSLISKQHVITAGHCVSRPRSQALFDPDSLLIYLGKYYLKKWTGTGMQDHQVSRIVRHPRYDSTTYTNDIAVIKLARQAEVTDYVRPVCLWQGSTDFNQIVGKLGTVVGWGFDETGKLTEELTRIDMPVVPKDTCIYSFPDFFSRFTTTQTYCAGFTNGSSVCNGDSGGGMVFAKDTGIPGRKVYFLRGMVSISVSVQNNFRCNPQYYVVFTDVAQYLGFVQQAMAS